MAATSRDYTGRSRGNTLKEYEDFVAKLKQQGGPPPPPPTGPQRTTPSLSVDTSMDHHLPQTRPPLGTPPRVPNTSAHGYHNTAQPAAVTPTSGRSYGGGGDSGGNSAVISVISEDEEYGDASQGDAEKHSGEEEEDGGVDVNEALLDLAQLEELHQEAERMKALGNKHMAAQEYTRAYNAYSAALQLSPVGPSSHVFLSNRSAALLSLKRYSAAATDARRAIALAPTFGKAHARLGQSLYFLKDYEGALAAYEDAIYYEPDNAVTRTYLEKAKTKLQRQKEKSNRIHRGEEMSVLTSESSMQMTAMNSIATDPNQSAAVVQTLGFRGQSSAMMRAVQNGQSSAMSVGDHTLGTTLTLEEEDEGAEDPDFDEALRIQDRANKYLANKNYKFAVEEYTAALFLVPDDDNLSPDLHLGRAHALNGSRRHESAVIDARLAIRIKPSPEAYSTMAKSLFYTKDYQGAINAFKKCQDILPKGESLSMFDRAYLQKSETALAENMSVTGESPRSVSSNSTPIPKLKPPRFVPREEALNRTPNIPAMPKQWPQQSPRAAQTFQCAAEREVMFLSEALGIKLNRGPDGIVRVIDVTPEMPGSPIVRKGKIEIGDVIREAAGVDIRRPITNIMWGDTVALIKMASRPIVLVVAKELSDPPPSIMEQRRQAAANHLSPSSQVAMQNEQSHHKSGHRVLPSFSSGDESVKYLMSRADNNTTIAFTEENERRNHPLSEPEASDTLDPPQRIGAVGNERVEMDTEGVVVGEARGVTEGSEVTAETIDIAEAVEGVDEVATSEKEVEDVEESTLLDPGDGLIESAEIPPELSTTRDEEFKKIGGEIMFERKAHRAYNGWDNLRWMAFAGVRKVKYCDWMYRLVPGRKALFWSGDQYLDRKIAIYEEPNVIMVLRRPTNIDEMREILDLRAGSKIEDPDTVAKSYLLVESVIDPNMCKLRMSPLTTVTSILPNVSEDDFRRRSCFELITPLETLVLSAVRLRRGAERALTSFTDSGAFLETSSAEFAFKKTICNAHFLRDEVGSSADLSWKHQIIIGTLHSYVVLGKQPDLDKAIEAALLAAKADLPPGEESLGFLDPRIVDALDETGRSPLHYACVSRSSAAVASLSKVGANVDLRTEPNSMTPLALCAKNLDDKSIAAILQCNRRPNALDGWGRTPMYIAIVDGRKVGGKRDADALGRCLNVLDFYGGQIVSSDMHRHPVSLLSSEWRWEELSVVLDYVCLRYPLPLDNIEDDSRVGISLSALYQYPVHSSLVALRKKIEAACSGEEGSESLGEEVMQSENKLVRTLQTLLGRGFEPNERLEGVVDTFVGVDELTLHIGFAPIQILGAAALDAFGQKDVLDGDMYMRLMSMITTVADCLVRHGARLSLDEPPTMRSTVRQSSSISDSSHGSGSQLPLVDRSKLKIQANQNLADLLGVDRLDASQMVWNSVKVVNACSGLILHDDTKSAIPDSQAPGGSNEKNCAICWRVFGALRFRRHRCRTTKRHVCDECSSKRIIANGMEHRISDGQFLLAKENDARQESERLVAEREHDRVKRSQTAQHAVAAAARLDRLEAEDRAQRDSLFGGVMEKMTTAVFGDSEAKDAASKASGEVSGLFASLGQTRDALNERGDKLNSLAEKSDKLVNASKDFASMAKELNRATSNKGLFW